MSKIAVFATLVLVAVLSVNAGAAERPNGNVPDSVMAKMGFAGMERMSDEQGKQVRGKGFVAVNLAIVNITTTVVNIGGPAFQVVSTPVNIHQSISHGAVPAAARAKSGHRW